MNWLILAQDASGAAGGSPVQPGPGSLLNLIIPFAGIFLIFYFLLIRPQKKQEKARQAMLKDLKKNDKVVTIGGIQGVVANVRDSDVTLKIDESGDVRVRFSRSAISRVITKDDEDSAKE